MHEAEAPGVPGEAGQESVHSQGRMGGNGRSE